MKCGVTKVREGKLNKKLNEPAVQSQKINMLFIPALQIQSFVLNKTVQKAQEYSKEFRHLNHFS